MIEEYLFENEEIVLDFTPNQDKLLKIHKQNIKLCKLSIGVFVFLLSLLTIVAGSIAAFVPIFLVFIPVMLIVYFIAKAQVNASKNAMLYKYILTDKRCIIFHTKEYSIKYILYEKIETIRNFPPNSFRVLSHDDNQRLFILNFTNVDNLDFVLMTIAQYKNS